jgi:hypothetical protein
MNACMGLTISSMTKEQIKEHETHSMPTPGMKAHLKFLDIYIYIYISLSSMFLQNIQFILRIFI